MYPDYCSFMKMLHTLHDLLKLNTKNIIKLQMIHNSLKLIKTGLKSLCLTYTQHNEREN